MSRTCWQICGCKCTTERKKWAGVTIGVVLGIMFIVLMSLSAVKVDSDKVFMPYNEVTRQLGDPLTEGLHFINPAATKKGYSFANRVIDLEDRTTCLSKDGLKIIITHTAQIRILNDRHSLVNTIIDFNGQNNLLTFTRQGVLNELLDTCANYLAIEFSNLREQIEIAMEANITHRLNHKDSKIEVILFQFRNVQLPTEFQNIIEDQLDSVEQLGLVQNQRPGILTRARTEVLIASQQAVALLQNANATREANERRVEQLEDAINFRWTQLLEFYVESTTRFNMTLHDYLLNIELPQLLARTMSPTREACLQICTDPECWWCWVGSAQVSPAV